ncbi:MAG TPA: lactate utilization protein B [Anaeromyxobacteraceae bacterium]|nr:lactate utilization protein B [Anaeromyxobacteraceae bacterium]
MSGSLPVPPGQHPRAAARFLAQETRVRRHDAAGWHLRSNRDRGAASVPEWEALREAASAIKGHVLSRLADYLEEFERNAAQNGIQVHWARDGAEHNAIVHGLLAGRGVTRVVKSKSMLTEECGLNPFLEARGIEVTDTDLGERIVQLLGEPPSHIVVPAIHRTKEEIGELFYRRLGTPAGLADPTALTEAARHHLRQKFLDAQAGITGVNFAIAETGGVVVVTNEGNADMGTSLPPIHVACMGVEKVVPRARDLGVLLRVLARSATGQPSSVYASHFHGPLPGGEMHVVIVDNGRSAILARDAFRPSLWCIRCGACLNTCPVYRRSGGYSYGATIPGPIGSVLSALRNPRAHADLPFASSLCGSCSDVCPVRIDLHQELLAFRRELAGQGLVPLRKRLAMKAASLVMRRPALYALAGRVVRFLLRAAPWALRLGPGAAWARQRALPPGPRESFRDLWQRRAAGGEGGTP